MTKRIKAKRTMAAALLMAACGGDPGGMSGPGDGGATAREDGALVVAADLAPMAGVVPELGGDATRRLVVVATAADGLVTPRALAFDPAVPGRLWVACEMEHGVVILDEAGTPRQKADKRVDRYGQHFMSRVSSIAFGAPGTFASCQESRDDWNDAPQPEDDFMGPTLWPSDLAVFARFGQDFPWVPGKPEGSHLDMLHESPLCMGIAHEAGNAYWAMDGVKGHLVRYDFRKDHGAGGGDHSDGEIHRFVDATIAREPGVPGHMAWDAAGKLLYVADPAGGRVMRFDPSGAAAPVALPGTRDGLRGVNYGKRTGGSWKAVVTRGRPSGIALDGGRLFVSDHGDGTIAAYDAATGAELGRMATGAKGVMGIAVQAGRLWFVDRESQTVVRVDP